MPETTVSTPDGDVAIADIEVGDVVYAYNELTGEVGEYTVTHTINHVDETIIHLYIDGELIETTAEHPFYTEDGTWIDAEDLEAGDLILSLDGDYGLVEAIVVVEDANQPMYNLTVDEAHTFFVGDGDWLVHNTCPIPFADNPEVWDEFQQDIFSLIDEYNLPEGQLIVQGSSVPGHPKEFRPVGSQAALDAGKASDIDLLLVLDDATYDNFGQARIEGAKVSGSQKWIERTEGIVKGNRFTSAEVGGINGVTMQKRLKLLTNAKYSSYIKKIQFSVVRVYTDFHLRALGEGFINILRP